MQAIFIDGTDRIKIEVTPTGYQQTIYRLDLNLGMWKEVHSTNFKSFNLMLLNLVAGELATAEDTLEAQINKFIELAEQFKNERIRLQSEE
ncbi:hypothetical protein ACLQ9N_05085 [Gallibacterium anatis]|uniref:hypothetical protein n=1 Tax=Gallibacterium anatis TaxID=750 RepID=UPI0039FC26B5